MLGLFFSELGHFGFPKLQKDPKGIGGRYREAELAHGRVCMLATLGYTVQTSGAKFEPFITRSLEKE